ncbi:unnamed protein product [Closterium sp. NIES-65]|nr:unnamed protein product [Closterium sp. NIES-65]
MADLHALRDELLGQLCRRCAGCDRHDANGEGGGTQDEPVKEPVRVKSPEEIARDFINAETGGWQRSLRTVSNTYTNTRCLIAKRLRKKVLVALGIKRRNDHDPLEDPKELDDAELLIGYGNEPLQGTEDTNLLLSPHLRYPPCLTLCLAEPLQGTEDTNLLLSPHLRYPPCLTLCLAEPLQGTAAPKMLFSPHLRLAPALLSAWQKHCRA